MDTNNIGFIISFFDDKKEFLSKNISVVRSEKVDAPGEYEELYTFYFSPEDFDELEKIPVEKCTSIKYRHTPDENISWEETRDDAHEFSNLIFIKMEFVLSLIQTPDTEGWLTVQYKKNF